VLLKQAMKTEKTALRPLAQMSTLVFGRYGREPMLRPGNTENTIGWPALLQTIGLPNQAEKERSNNI
jgi:hypothetical protein